MTRVIHGRRPGEDQRSLGLVFEAVEDEQQMAIARELMQIPPAPPGRVFRGEHSDRVARVLAFFSTRIAPSWEN